MGKQQCPLCGEHAAVHETRESEYVYKGVQYSIIQPGLWCDSCDDAVISPADRKASQKDRATAHAIIDGVLTPDEIKRARKIIKLTQAEAAEYFGGGVNAFSKYERGEIQIPKAVSLLLSLLVERTIALDSLSAVAEHLTVEHSKFWARSGKLSLGMQRQAS
ncbi:type II toxin-antitoxin system MqsA family antitoxin [Piscirickettsia litoralis]|uniref:HTH cro/C1-type domain-containing protein n=1 Tax=Piscirickettsia litoralis TaxID=1891921 RepID=A0ABX3A1R9_9GAMM|nr:type II toxin-antitoxin system MqsA family antitoxin [Piscirickettsia litoralis]ODN41573.1 hypothetical protein BGC07_15820 [Piscirickettsia litoralis]